MLRKYLSCLFFAAAFLISSLVQAQQGSRMRHYFEHCQDRIYPPLSVGMTRDEVRELAGGQEYPPFETVRGGFAFALDEKRSGFYVLSGWMPQESIPIDFFISDQNIMYVRYGVNNRVVVLSKYPLRSSVPSQ